MSLFYVFIYLYASTFTFLFLVYVRTFEIYISSYDLSTCVPPPLCSTCYINFLLNHPYQYKINTISNLIDQAILLSDKRFHNSNLEFVKKILSNNCYPINIVNKQIKKGLK